MRLFLAADISEEIRRELDTFMRPLREEREVKWVQPPNLHITLYFLGHLHEDQLPEVRKVAAESVKGIPPFTVNVRYVSGFPTPRRPRVIWAGVTGSDYLAAIYEALRQGLAQSSLDVKIEKRAYTPHITLGRAKNKCPPHLVDNLEQSAHAEFGTCTVDRIVLYQSTLTRKGAQYDPVHSFMFER